MLGAIAGDMIGSVYEGAPPQPIDFPLLSMQSRFTDDSVMTIRNAVSLGGEVEACIGHFRLPLP